MVKPYDSRSGLSQSFASGLPLPSPHVVPFRACATQIRIRAVGEFHLGPVWRPSGRNGIRSDSVHTSEQTPTSRKAIGMG